MATKELGRATYSAFRFGKLLWLSAKGESANLNDKHNFEQLPFRIFPPIIGFFVIHPDFTLRATREFIYTEIFTYPDSADFVRIRDADGGHEIEILTLEMKAREAKSAPIETASYCVFQDINSKELLIAECDQPLPTVYRRVFGPSTLAECEKYVNAHGG